jgi:hypothetical protein
MSESEFNTLRELSWRRPLTPVEEARLQAYLAANPAQQAAWEEEFALTHALQQLPHAPVSSNFTALVLQSLDRPEPRVGGAGWGWPAWLQPRWLRLAWVSALLVLLMAGYGGYRAYSQRQLEQGVKILITAIPEEPDAFANFDAIQKLGSVPTMDDELWLALNQ